MRRLLFLSVVAVVALGGIIAPAEAQLKSDRAEGSSRYCTYGSSDLPEPIRVYSGEVRQERENSTERATRATRTGRVVRVESWQACPASDPGLKGEQVSVPAFATLSSQSRRDGELSCTYTFAFRNYVVSRGAAMVCPLTPHY